MSEELSDWEQSRSKWRLVLLVSGLMIAFSISRSVRWSKSSQLKFEEVEVSSLEQKFGKGKSRSEWIEFRFVNDSRVFKLMSQDYGSARIPQILEQIGAGDRLAVSYQLQLATIRLKTIQKEGVVYTDENLATTKESENTIWVNTICGFILLASVIPSLSKSRPTLNFVNLAVTGSVVIILILTFAIGCDSLYQK